MRLRNLTLAISLIVLVSGLLAAPAFAKDTSISTLKHRLQHARAKSRRAHERVRAAAANLAGARDLYAATDAARTTPQTAATTDPATGAVPAIPSVMDHRLATNLLSDGVVTADEVAALRVRLNAVKRVEHRWDVKVKQLKKRIRQLRRIAEWNRRGQWKPLIAIAAAKYGVSKAGLHRMMLLESGGRRTAGTTFKGLFQYYPSTWSGSWNPWRHESVYDGWAQIRATAYAISRGMGPSQWPNTYPMAF